MKFKDRLTAPEFAAERLAMGLTQADLAKSLDVNPRTVRRWEDGCDIPATAVLALYALSILSKENWSI